MNSPEHILSVDVIIAGMMARKIAVSRTPRLDGDLEYLIAEHIHAALILSRKQLAEPRVGNMTFDQAMAMVADGTLVARPKWGILIALMLSSGDNGEDEVNMYELDNWGGSATGYGIGLYKPSDEDRAATDWMKYEEPICVYWPNTLDNEYAKLKFNQYGLPIQQDEGV